METLHARHGKLPWADLFQPAIHLARQRLRGEPASGGLAGRYAERLSGTDAAAVFLPDGKPVTAGVILKQPTLAETFDIIAAQGGNAFYTGPLAERIVAAARRVPRPGALGPDDLAAYRVVERPAVCHRYRRYRICGMGPAFLGGDHDRPDPDAPSTGSRSMSSRLTDHGSGISSQAPRGWPTPIGPAISRTATS